MTGEAFGLRRAEREVEAALDANAAEVRRCLDIADDALRAIRRKERAGASILPADARMLTIVAALWTRDRQPPTFDDAEADALYGVAARALGESGGNVTTAAHALAAAAATGLLADLIALERR